MKKLIINADDFGQTKGITDAILKANKKGIITSTTIITNYENFEDTLEKIKKNSSLKYGFHLNLVDGKALSGKSSLTNKKGEFFSLGKLFIKLCLFQIKKNDLEKEIEIQLLKLINNNIKVTHADGHRHTHIFPLIIKSYLKILKKYKIDKIRLPNEKLILSFKYEKFNLSYLTKILVTICSIYSKKIINKNKFKTNDFFLGMNLLGIEREKHLDYFIETLKFVPNNKITEILVHPGYFSKKLKQICPQYNKERETELNTLINLKVKNELKKLNIRLITYEKL